MIDMSGNHVRTTIVGSLPKPSWLCGPGEMFASWRLAGATLKEGQEDAVRVWVAEQEKAGLDVMTDGEQRRRHYIWGFFEGLHGIDTVNLGKRPQRGRRYHNEISAARMISEPEWPGPIFADALRATRAMTGKPIKVTLPGPMTIVDSLIDGWRPHRGTTRVPLRRTAQPGGTCAGRGRCRGDPVR
jgi:5-methyltetrahydropteroyltriglutamate--homocysteine methyltransferase